MGLTPNEALGINEPQNIDVDIYIDDVFDINDKG